MKLAHMFHLAVSIKRLLASNIGGVRTFFITNFSTQLVFYRLWIPGKTYSLRGKKDAIDLAPKVRWFSIEFHHIFQLVELMEFNIIIWGSMHNDL